MAGSHSNKAVNEWIGQWLCAVPVGADLASYRSYHLQHHKFTQQPEDPDLSLSAPFPITKESYTRKAIRDLTGQTFVKQRLPLFLSLFQRPAADERGIARKLCLQRPRQDGCASWSSTRCCSACSGSPARASGIGRVWVVAMATLAAAGHTDPQHRRTRLHLNRRRPVQPRPHHARQSDRAPVDRALLGELPRRASSLHVSAVLPAARSASAAGEKGLVKRMEVKPGYLDVMRLATSSQRA